MAYRYEDRQVSHTNTSLDNEKIMRAHRRREKRIREELGMESQIIEIEEPWFETRLNRSRILETDEDNLY